MKKERKYLWMAIISSFFAWVPFLNILIFLPLAIYLSSKQIRLAKVNADKYGGIVFPIICIVWFIALLMLSIVGFIRTFE